MIDTVSLVSPVVGEWVVSGLQARMEAMRRLGVQTATGAVEYDFTTADLLGSFDHRLRVALLEAPDERLSTECEAVGRRLRVEGSVHKAMMGHNLYGGPEGLQEACRWLVELVGRAVGAEIPPASTWELHRVDWAEAFDLGSFEAVEEYFAGLGGVRFPRRKVAHFGFESVNVPGTSSSVKVYHKGPEFSKHDFARLCKVWGTAKAFDLQTLSNRLVRCEVEVKRKLKDDYGHWPKVGEVETEYLVLVYDRDIDRLLRESGASVEIVRTHQAVSQRLAEVYPPRLANALFGTWLQLAALGENVASKHVPKRTYYRHRPLLESAGVSWQGADVQIVERESLVPAGFTPRRCDPRRLSGEDPQVELELEPYRKAS